MSGPKTQAYWTTKASENAKRFEKIKDASLSTGLPMKTLKQIEITMDERNRYSMLSHFALNPKLPSTNSIIHKLLMGHSNRGRSNHGDHFGISLYQISISSKVGNLRIMASYKSKNKKRLFGDNEETGLITIKYQVYVGARAFTYRQTILLKNGQFVKTKHTIKSHTNENVLIGNTQSGVTLLMPAQEVAL